MQTLAEMVTRVLRIESQEDTTDTNTRAAVADSINEAFRVLATTYQWLWMMTETTIASVSGDTHLSMPADFIALSQLENAAGAILDPRHLDRQLEYAAPITNKSIYTYALQGTDTSGYIRMRLWPVSSGDTYTLHYQAMPATLVLDADVPAGPIGLDDYLVRQARALRAEDDEEQSNVVANAERRAAIALSGLARTAGQPLRMLTGAIIPLRG